MLGSIASMAVQTSVIPPSQALSTCTSQSQETGGRRGRNGDQTNSQVKKMASSVNMSSPICDTASPPAAAASSGPNVDERLKAARERREQHQRLLASREQDRLEREQRARKYFELQLQQRRKKLLEQRRREERRRAAVEEKRKQRLKEEKERYESSIRRTLQRSQRAQQNVPQNPRGRNATRSAPRRLPLTPWEKNLVSRLAAPTCSFLARSKSAACQSGEEASFHSMNTSTSITSITTPQKQQHFGSVHIRPPASPGSNSRPPASPGSNSRPSASPGSNSRPSASPGSNSRQHRSISHAQDKSRQQDATSKNSNTGSPAVNTRVKPARVKNSRTATASPERRRSSSRLSTPLQPDLPSVPEEDAPACSSALPPGNSRPVGMPAAGQQGEPRTPPETPCSTSAGVTDPEEASRVLSAKRREATLQRERQEEQRLRREEAERRSQEELERRRAEERDRLQAEAQHLIEEKRKREEEEQRRADEERAQAMREAVLLQEQRKEERDRAEQVRQEREILSRREEEARQARRKRLEEIMRRTRRTDSPDTTSAPAGTLPKETQPKENTQPMINGAAEDVKLPLQLVVAAAAAKTSELGLKNETDEVPVVAFKERRSLRNLAGLEEIQTHQRAEVI